jgi:ABC-type lipoprotein release transport system permease subunit
VVGVVGDVQQHSNWGEFGLVGPARSAYLPAAQIEGRQFLGLHGFFSPQWIVRTTGSSPDLARVVQEAIASVDPQLPVAGFRSMYEVRNRAFSTPRVVATLLASLAVLALLLVGIGIYGLIANSVVERTREFGIRLALGSTRMQAVSLAARSGLILTLVGMSIGFALARLAGATMRSMLWGVAPDDAMTFAFVSAILFVTAFAASLFPSLVITRIDPAKTLQ